METKKSIILSEKAPSREHVWLNPKDNTLRYFNGQKWIAVGKEEEKPVAPIVVAIGHNREVPSSVSLFVGDYDHYMIAFDDMDYVSTISDFSCDTEGVTVSLDAEFDNILSVSIDSAVPAGTVAEVYFRDQLIMNVTAVEKPVHD